MTDQPTPTPRTDAAQIERQEYEEATRECDRIALPERPKDAWELCRELERELAAERAMADRLAETLRFIEEDCDWKAGGDHWHGSFGDDRIGPACDEALAAWKEARRE